MNRFLISRCCCGDVLVVFFFVVFLIFFFLMIRRPPRSTLDRSSAASDVYKRQAIDRVEILKVKNSGEQIETVKHNLNPRSELKKIVIPTSEGLLFFDVNEIINIEAQSNYSYIYFKDCLLYTSPSPRDRTRSLMPSSA